MPNQIRNAKLENPCCKFIIHVPRYLPIARFIRCYHDSKSWCLWVSNGCLEQIPHHPVAVRSWCSLLACSGGSCIHSPRSAPDSILGCRVGLGIWCHSSRCEDASVSVGCPASQMSPLGALHVLFHVSFAKPCALHRGIEYTYRLDTCRWIWTWADTSDLHI